MRVSIIIPTSNRRETVLRTVDAVLRQGYPASDCEIIVVVDGGSDGTAEALRAFDSERRLRIVEQENRGPASARNEGFRAADGELLIFLDDDMICSPGWLRAHILAHASSGGEEFVGMGGIYATPDGPPSLAADEFSNGIGTEYLLHRDSPDRPWPGNVWSFANTSIRRKSFESAGGFDERFRMREDCELGARLLKLGIRQRFVGDAVAYQHCDKSPERLVRDAERFAEYDVLFLKTHPGLLPHDFLAKIRCEARWKRAMRHWISRRVGLADVILRPVCAMGDRRQAPGALRKLALRALLFRSGLHWYSRMREIAGVPPEDLAGREL